MLKLDRNDHVFITVKNINGTIDIYTNILNMRLKKILSCTR